MRGHLRVASMIDALRDELAGCSRVKCDFPIGDAFGDVFQRCRLAVDSYRNDLTVVVGNPANYESLTTLANRCDDRGRWNGWQPL